MDAHARRAEEPADAQLIVLERGKYTERGTFGRWRMLGEDGPVFDTVELPWRGNAVGESCIPEGVYRLEMRRSAVVERTSGGAFKRGWEVTDVPGRSYIMLHPGNTIDDLEGCIAVGQGRGSVGGLPAVLHSRATFTILMRLMDPRLEWNIDIRHAEGADAPGWP